MTDIEILVYCFLVLATAGSYYLGHKRGIKDAVNIMEELGIIDFTDTPEK